MSCPICNGELFNLSRDDGVTQISCIEGRRSHWSQRLPFSIELECGHDFLMENDQPQMELLPNAELLSVIASVINKYLTDYEFDAGQEGFFIRKSKLYYYGSKDMIPQLFPKNVKNVFNTHVEVGTVYGGEVTGVKLRG